MSHPESSTSQLPSLADFLRDEREDIVRDFLALDRRTLASARRVVEQEDLKALLDHIPDVLDTIEAAARATEAGAPDVPPLRHDARRHALHRLHQHFTLDELAREYSLLRGVLLTRLGPRAGALSTRERMLLHESIDEAVLVAVKAYTERDTARLKSEQQLRSTVLEQLPSAVLIVEAPGGRLLYTNPQVARMLRAPPPSVGGIGEYHRYRGFHLDGRPLKDEEWPIARSIQQGELVEGEELRMERGDGTRGTFSVSSTPIRDEAGNITSGVAILSDITARKEAEEALERALAQARRTQAELQQARAEAELERTRLHSLFLQAPVAFAILRGPRYVIELANPLVCRFWGRGHEQLIGRPLFDALPEVVGQGIQELLDGVMATGTPYVGAGLHVRLAKAEGGALEDGYFNVVYEPLRDTGGRVEGIIVVATDVTENVAARKRMESLAQALHDSQERLRLVTDAIPYLVSFVDTEERYQLNNKTYERWFSRTPEGLHGVTVRERSGEANYARVQGPIRRALQGEYVTFETPYTYPGNREGFLEATFIPQRAPDGQVVGFVAVAMDISERKRLEAEQRQRAEFEQQLIGIVSHDLRNPISAIAMSAGGLLRRQGLDERTLGGITRILGSADRANRMIRDLLDFTQARLGGGIPLERKPGDLHELTRQVVEEVRLGAPEREILLEHAGDARGEWDADRLAQVVTNLVGNALAYSPPDTPVRVRTAQVEGEVVLSVHNQGEPIAPELLPRIFEPLQRAVPRAIHATRSIGLGLFIVREIVRGHGGRIEVRSTRDAGTTFSVFLPHAG
ncbi:PAS domain-containing protein [Pyxidicoccus xibeiensis]|uniref:PAS domain-containing protein n=1 Tax=Pyxidicoccus xibeiensis TaxID=2906759 RepID=UPI0020A7025A|nr:PAS domain-containing protein [Pyxidicoccus xibeiensis]MCP3141346.1 PAS domain-containing protein [Pyxidicoccus xibeiensis]